ncbi:MAG: hypothetical protein A2X86_08085 [Bdellovibrionales bacterium GWA2_49_15]|nr:MAG: hypothetical protein A2X86_08085 [Bdellovibrionales bacterium GWA2_49_15]HAZ13271.1 hypothetical protein [Bdellovibrionales bacterium]
MNPNVTTQALIEGIKDTLKWSQKSIASHIGVSETRLSQLLDRPFAEIRDGKIGKRLGALYSVVKALLKHEPLLADSPKAIAYSLTTPVVEDLNFEGFKLSCLMLIQQGTVDPTVLFPIAQKALETYKSGCEKHPIFQLSSIAK